MLIFLSDLHLTDWEMGGAVADGELAAFCTSKPAAWCAGRPVTLILLGDVVDLLRSSRWKDCSRAPWAGLFRMLGQALRLVGPTDLKALPYEELLNHWDEPGEVYKEFARRLDHIVFLACKDYVLRHPDPAGRPVEDRAGAPEDEWDDVTMVIRKLRSLEDRAGALKDRAFVQCLPLIRADPPETALVRFARLLRESILDEAAFESIRELYYKQVPLYHIRNATQRELLAQAYDTGLHGDFLAEIAVARGLSPAEAAGELRGATEALVSAQRRIDPDRLRRMTEGTLPE